MARKKSSTLTDAELRLMKVIWKLGEATVGQVVEALSDQNLAYSTVLTTLRILEQKGYLTHRKQGRAFVYRALVAYREASRSATRHLLSRFFEDSPELLVLNILEDSDMHPEELKRLRDLIEADKNDAE